MNKVLCFISKHLILFSQVPYDKITDCDVQELNISADVCLVSDAMFATESCLTFRSLQAQRAAVAFRTSFTRHSLALSSPSQSLKAPFYSHRATATIRIRVDFKLTFKLLFPRFRQVTVDTASSGTASDFDSLSMIHQLKTAYCQA